MIKVPWFRFQQCFGQYTMLHVEGFSETALLRHLSNHLFGVLKFKHTSVMRDTFCLKMFKIECKFRKWIKNSETIFGF